MGSDLCRTLLPRTGRVRIDPAAMLAAQQRDTASDQTVDADYGRAYAVTIPGARLHLLHATRHVPQIETPQQLSSR